ncbi:hypothetical protein HN873_035006 [Arachis hypogaea]
MQGERKCTTNTKMAVAPTTVIMVCNLIICILVTEWMKGTVRVSNGEASPTSTHRRGALLFSRPLHAGGIDAKVGLYPSVIYWVNTLVICKTFLANIHAKRQIILGFVSVYGVK